MCYGVVFKFYLFDFDLKFDIYHILILFAIMILPSEIIYHIVESCPDVRDALGMAMSSSELYKLYVEQHKIERDDFLYMKSLQILQDAFDEIALFRQTHPDFLWEIFIDDIAVSYFPSVSFIHPDILDSAFKIKVNLVMPPGTMPNPIADAITNRLDHACTTFCQHNFHPQPT